MLSGRWSCNEFNQHLECLYLQGEVVLVKTSRSENRWKLFWKKDEAGGGKQAAQAILALLTDAGHPPSACLPQWGLGHSGKQFGAGWDYT